MIIKKNDKTFIVTEFADKWKVLFDVGKLSAVYDVSKELCPTADELRAYILKNDLF